MGIDLSKVKNTLNQMESKGNKWNNNGPKPWEKNIHKLTPGKYNLRIVPLKDSADWPFITIKQYYKFGGVYTSPTSYDETAVDPIMDFAKGLYSSKDETKKGLAKKISPTTRYYVAAIIRGREDEGVKFWGFGWKIYKQLITILDDADYGDITDVKTGRDLKLVVQSKEQTGNDYGETTFTMSPNTTPLSSDKEEIKLWLNTQPSMEETFPPAKSEVLEKVLDKYMNKLDGKKGSSDEEQKSMIKKADDGSRIVSEKSNATIKENSIKDLETALDDDGDIDFDEE